MAVNAKVGLLVGLLAVFVLAFALNSAHRSGDREAGNDLAPVVVEGPSGIRPEIPPDALPPAPVASTPAAPGPAALTTERYRAPLPEIAATEANAPAVEPPKPPAAPAPTPPVVRYIVGEGDSLAYIARKFYGPEQGNKKANVMKIFEANRNILKSPDEIDVGQELVIPPLETQKPQTNAEPNIFPDSIFEKVDSIGRKPL